MNGKIIGIGLLTIGLLAGAALYYLQIYGFYTEISDGDDADVRLVSVVSGEPEPIGISNFQAIDAESSPIRFRACFQADMSLAALTEGFELIDAPNPRNAPHWFECFDAEALGAEIKAGTALTFLGQKNIHFGVDRIVAVTDDGRGYAWHELNDCGAKAYDGTIVGEECPRLDN